MYTTTAISITQIQKKNYMFWTKIVCRQKKKKNCTKVNKFWTNFDIKVLTIIYFLSFNYAETAAGFQNPWKNPVTEHHKKKKVAVVVHWNTFKALQTQIKRIYTLQISYIITEII